MTIEVPSEIRDALALILETIATDGLLGPRDVDVALDAVLATVLDDIEVRDGAIAWKGYL